VNFNLDTLKRSVKMPDGTLYHKSLHLKYFAPIVINTLKRIDIEKQIRIVTGYSGLTVKDQYTGGHTIYITFIKVAENQVEIRLDNFGDIQPTKKEIFKSPIDKKLETYINNIMVARFLYSHIESKKLIYDDDKKLFKDDQRFEDKAPFHDQLVGNCTLYNLTAGTAINFGSENQLLALCKLEVLYQPLTKYITAKEKEEDQSKILNNPQRILYGGGMEDDEVKPKLDTNLLHAAYNGYLGAIEWLINHGHSPLDEDELSMAPLLAAAQNGHREVVNWLLNYDSSLAKQKNLDGNNVLNVAAFNGHLELVQFLITQGFSPKEKNNLGNSAFLEAATNGHLEVAKFLLEYDPSFAKDKDSNENNALMLASFSGHLEFVQWMLNNNPSIANKKNIYGNNALLLASVKGNLEIVQFLVRNGCSPKDENNFGSTALLESAFHGHLKILQWLLSFDATLAHKSDIDGNTALLLAVDNEKMDVVQWLLKTGKSKISEKNNEGKTALNLAKTKQMQDFLEIMYALKYIHSAPLPKGEGL
jgi:ankyrin repeat protein